MRFRVSSELQSQAQLDQARAGLLVAEKALLRGDYASLAYRGNVAGREIVVRVVEEVRDHGHVVEVEPLGDREPFRDADVVVVQTRTLQDVDAAVSEAARGGPGEGGDVEPAVERAAVGG